MNIYGRSSWHLIDEYNLETVPFDIELIDSKYHICFNVCFAEVKLPHTLMFWQNLDRLRHKIEEAAYVPFWEWVRIPFGEGEGDPINTISLMFCDKGKVSVFIDGESIDSHLFLCDEKDVVEKLYTNLLKWTQLYDDSIVGQKGYENVYSKEEAFKHLKSPIIEEYLQDIKNNNYIWRHYASEPGHRFENDENDHEED